MIAHRPGVIAAVDSIAVLGNGQLTAIGPRDEILRKVIRPIQAADPASGGGGQPGTTVMGQVAAAATA